MSKVVGFIAPLTENENQGGITSIARYLQKKSNTINTKHHLQLTFIDSCSIDKAMNKRGKISLVNFKNAYLLLQSIKANYKKGISLFHYNTSCGLALLKDLIVMTLAIKQCRSIQFIIHIHFAEIDQVLPKNKLLAKLTLKLLNAENHRIITLGNKLKSELIELGFDKTKIHRVYNFHDYDKLAKTQNSKQEVSLLFIGSLDERKGLLDIIKALKGINSSQFQLNVCGTFQNDEYKLKVINLIHSIGIEDKVHFKGFIENEVKADVYNNSDILLLPSYGEGLPLVLLEAMATNNSVIISDVGSISEIFSEPENGFLIEPGDIESLSKHIQYLISNPKELSRQKTNNLKLSIKFTGDNFIESLKKIYTS